MISVVIPYYNHESELPKALASIAGQQGVVTEVILVDDGSEQPVDISRLQHIISNVRLVRHAENKGAPAARNTGLREVKGSTVIFWDADVIGKPDMLQQMKHVLDTKKDIDFVYSNFIFGPKRFTGQVFSEAALRERNYIHSTTLVRREVAPFWDESLTKLQDWDYWLTLAQKGSRGYWIDEVLFTVGQRKEGMSRWIPSFAYRAPFRWLPFVRKQVQKYEQAKVIVQKKHGLIKNILP